MRYLDGKLYIYVFYDEERKCWFYQKELTVNRRVVENNSAVWNIPGYINGTMGLVVILL